MKEIRAKKHLGQHFLNDQSIAKSIVEACVQHTSCTKVLEVGPGMGVLTNFLIEDNSKEIFVIDIDHESINYLNKKYGEMLPNRIIHADFLKMEFNQYFNEPFSIIGNFPYNISTQIFFKIIENKEQVPLVVGMVQKEVAERIAAKHGNKTYGITSVLLQAFYDIEYLFTVHEHVFTPPPKVKSGVIRLKRNNRLSLPCSEKLFFSVVKQSFSMRRKTLRNCLKAIINDASFLSDSFFDKRAEQLSVEDFVQLTVKIETFKNSAS